MANPWGWEGEVERMSRGEEGDEEEGDWDINTREERRMGKKGERTHTSEEGRETDGRADGLMLG